MMRAIHIGFLLLLVTSRLAFACQCNQLSPVSRSVIDSYDLVFIGTVSAVSHDEKEGRAHMAITSLFKGQSMGTIELHFDNSSDCAMNFLPNETWIVYANWTDFNTAKAELCGHSRRLPNAGEEDYYVAEGRTDFASEEKWLKDSVGVQKFSEPAIDRDLLHKNEKPDPTQAIIYTVCGFLGLALIFYFVRRMFRKDGK